MEFNISLYPISWFRQRYQDGTLTIKPPYQRKPVWTARQKSYLIESILLKLPIPEIYVQQITSPQGDTSYAVVDGQQRVRTILQFIGSETDPEEYDSNKFALDSLPTSSPWRKCTFADLTNEHKIGFYNYQLAVRHLHTNSDDEVRDMFKRLNKFLTPLNAQELRNATYIGPFVDLTLKLADNEYWTENGLFTPALIRRMRDVEFISDLLIGVLHGPQGGSAAVIDHYYEQYEDYEDEFPDQRRAEKLFNRTLATVEKILPRIKEVRWKNKQDFYTLFVTLATLLRFGDLPENNTPALRDSLYSFAAEIDTRVANDRAKVDRVVVEYVRAITRGANDKKRRANRQAALRSIIEPYFELDEPALAKQGTARAITNKGRT